MTTMSREQFKRLVGICRSYDPFTEYIEDYAQMLGAQTANNVLERKFAELMEEVGIECSGCVPCTNKGEETENSVMQWLMMKDVTVEEEKKRIWTEAEIKTLVQTNDKVLYGALKNLYNCQTADEQSSAETTHANGAGFNALDAEFLTSVSKFLLKNGYLTDKQKVIVRKKLVKYNKQLTRLANA